MVEAEKQEQNVKSSRRKFTFGGRSKNAKRPRPVKQIERERERARRAKEAGPDATRKGKYPCCTQ
jgi:hypothetical protein